MIGCLTEATTCVVAKALVLDKSIIRKYELKIHLNMFREILSALMASPLHM